MKKMVVFSDGGSRSNPGPAAIGVVLYDENKKKLKKYKEYIGVATNNQAEYRALIKGIELAQEYEPEEIECYLDSELVVKQLKGEYKVKNEGVKKLYNEVNKLIFFKPVSFTHIRREKNQEADELVNKALDETLKKGNKGG